MKLALGSHSCLRFASHGNRRIPSASTNSRSDVEAGLGQLQTGWILLGMGARIPIGPQQQQI